MKKLMWVLALLPVQFAMAQNITVNADKKLNTDFTKYKTYAYASQVDSKLDEGFYFLNDLVLKKRIRDAVTFAMDGRGYKYTRTKPDLLVNFRVFDKPATIKGFTGYGQRYWSNEEYRDPESATTYDVKAGTLLLSLLDMKTGQVVWQGFASGLMDGNVFNRNEDKIREAVTLIFDKYNTRADGISKR
ncbi:hypothetical protein BN8_01957 [Fibrisoma limi BUZ 3]|uniref:DUF4136 domain-containing protein n=1 Tax=Fibrisoma limi BUZ 3 TaxID=1185876 RepID=I2GG90_9BACT|nr:DUF4136 domain-containing protein [Fibrisoma limi]CCH52915.1 hypothetical protein BN8_01957 [Fibrisoma limi BUZ 3]